MPLTKELQEACREACQELLKSGMPLGQLDKPNELRVAFATVIGAISQRKRLDAVQEKTHSLLLQYLSDSDDAEILAILEYHP